MNIALIPFVGFGQIKFGQDMDQVKQLLGEPTETTREKHDDGTEDVSFLYGEKGIELSFMSEDDYKLGLISCYAPTYSIDSQLFLGKTENEFLNESNFSDLELSDDFANLKAKDYTVNSKGLSFWIQDGHVHSITLFPKYKGDNIIWPE